MKNFIDSLFNKKSNLDKHLDKRNNDKQVELTKTNPLDTKLLYFADLFYNEKFPTIEFTFSQIVKEKIEKGSCLLQFPGKLKCEYFDDKQKELVINNKKLAITQKRYKKTYHYPISKSPFLNILYKEKLLEIIKTGKLELNDKLIKLTYINDHEIIVFFDKNTLDLKGWKILDQYNNNINFSLNIVAKNEPYKIETFKIPKIN